MNRSGSCSIFKLRLISSNLLFAMRIDLASLTSTVAVGEHALATRRLKEVKRWMGEVIVVWLDRRAFWSWYT